MGKYRSTLILFLILSAASFFTDELASLAGDMGLYVAVVQFRNPPEGASLNHIEFEIEEGVSKWLQFYNEPAGWRCYKDALSFHLVDGVLAPGGSVTIELACYKYFPFIEYPITMTGFTSDNTSISGETLIKFKDVIPLRVLSYISRSPNQSVLFGLTGLFFVIEAVYFILDRCKNETPKPQSS